MHIHRIEDPHDGELIDVANFCSDNCHRDWCESRGHEYGGWDGCHETEFNDWCVTCGAILPGQDACEHQLHNVAVRRFLPDGEMCECGNWIQFPLARLTQ